MPAALAAYILAHGYSAIFGLVFLQEIGVPNPVPNELVLLFSGYLAWTGAFRFPLIFGAAVAADFLGTSLLYGAFYFFGGEIVARFPKILPLDRIERFTKKLAAEEYWSIFAGRLLPYVRGYVSVAAGLLRVPPRIFFPSVLFSAVVWSGGYVAAGRLLGPEWASAAAKLGAGAFSAALLILAVAVLAGWLGLRRARGKRRKPQEADRGSENPAPEK